MVPVSEKVELSLEQIKANLLNSIEILTVDSTVGNESEVTVFLPVFVGNDRSVRLFTSAY